ncbi:antiterminator [Escherichia coli O145:NM str. 2010C-3516]|nr:antiterminator [Escherichia coli O145:NM str. 2010C-3516]
MIYPTNTGKSGEHLRLTTLESVWIQGKLRMWGRWSYIGGGKTGNMFNQLLTSKKLTKTAINEALRRMKKAGLDKPELEAFLRDMINGKQKSWLVHCTDAEALCIDQDGENFIFGVDISYAIYHALCRCQRERMNGIFMY